MKKSTLELICCPVCKSTDFELQIQEENDGDIITGEIICRPSGHRFDIHRGIPRMLSMHTSLIDTKDKFEHQWKTWGEEDVIFGRTKEESQKYLLKYAGFDLKQEDFKGKRILDAGCGHGRFVELFSDSGAEISVGIDLGEGIEKARLRNQGKNNVELVQGNLLEMPFRPGVFDYVWCNGVVHHTPDPKGAVRNLCDITKEEGYVNLWLYPKGSSAWEISQSAIRSITTKLPPAVLSALCYLPVPLLYIVPTYSGTNPRKNSWRHCAQVIYDWYSPKYQSHHTNEEVVGWFEEFGFSKTDVLDLAVTVIGQK